MLYAVCLLTHFPQDLFTRIGPISTLSLRYDRAGRSEGVAFVAYDRLGDARTAIREFDGANAKGQPIRLTLLPAGGGRRDRNPFDHVEKPKGSLFDRVERPHGRYSRSLSPGDDTANGESRRRRDHRGGRRSDVSKPAPDHIDRYVPSGRRSPAHRGGGGGRRGDRRNRTDTSGQAVVNGRPRKTQEELDQEMDDYWGGTNTEAEPTTATEQAIAPEVSQTAPEATAAAGDNDVDMIE